jgi:diguanylate cyclase (GGDEF)-like protein/PAS domain S-box-containing protein
MSKPSLALDGLRHLLNDEAKLMASPNLLEFGEADVQIMSVFSKQLESYCEDFGAKLYQYLSEITDLASFDLTSLKHRQSPYFSGVHNGWINPVWVRSRIDLGLNQYRIGLMPSWYFNVYRKILLDVLPSLMELDAGESEQMSPCFQSLIKVIWFDLAVACENFFADDERGLAFHEQIEKMKLQLATPKITGKQYLQFMANELAHVLNVRYAMVGQIRGPDYKVADVLAMTDNGKAMPGFSYELANTPCNMVLEQHRCLFPACVQQLFPKDESLIELNAQAYAGLILHDPVGMPLGLLVVMHDQAFSDLDRIGQMMAAFSGRAASEIERLHSQQSLLESEARFRAAFNQAAVGICHGNLQGKLILVNKKICSILGYQESELMGQSILDITWPDDREKSREASQSLLNNPDNSVILEKRYLHKNGHAIWAQATLSVTLKADGQIDYLMAVIEDISSRKKLQSMLHLSNRALESSGNGVVISDATDSDHKVIFANSAFTRITGYGLDEIIGRNCRFLQKDDLEQIEIKAIREALLNHQEIHTVVRNYRKDGSLFWNELTISPVPDEMGKITHFIGIMNDITAERSNQEQLAFQATHDELTGLPNRNLLNDRLPQALHQARRRNNSVALLFLDVDHFKLINDSIGHAAGDELLRGFAGRLSSCVRSGDTVSRHGGDEFVIVLKDILQSTHVGVICENIFRAIAEPFQILNHKIHTTCSIGIALFPQDGEDAETLSKFADMALYRAKDLGRGNFQFFSSEMNQRTQERVTLESALRSAIANDQLYMHYQPLVDLRTGQVISLEALLRWNHPELGLVAPDRFISVAEESGLIGSIGEWVLARACQDIRRWLDHGVPAVRVAVNVSPKQFRDARLGDKIEAVLREHKIEPRYLTLEITETVLMQDTASSGATLRQLKQLGVSLALDDFGTGYSSLSYLKRFPFDRVKIDRAFVRDIINDTDDAALCKTIITMAHSLGIMVIAEGVESEEQCTFLRTNLCDEIQGYLFSRPLPTWQIEELLREQRCLPVHLLGNREQRCILIVDQANNSDILPLAHSLAGEDVRILCARTGAMALDMLSQHRVTLVAIRSALPDMDSQALLRQIQTTYPETAAFMVSA